MRSLKDAKMEVNGSGGRLGREKTSGEKSVKKEAAPKKKRYRRKRGKDIHFPIPFQGTNEKRKVIRKPVKAPLGIDAKRKGHRIISLNTVQA